LTNDGLTRGETNNFLESVCLKGTFKAGYLEAKEAAGNDTEVSAKSQRSVCNYRGSTKTTFFIPFEKAIEWAGRTQKNYR